MENRYEAFTLLISSISRSIRRIKADAVEKFGLKSPHVTCLYYLHKRSGMTSAELCELCDEDKAAISRSILYLEENGFLARLIPTPLRKARGGGHHYRASLVLTEKGEEAARYISERIDRALEQVSRGVSEKEREVLYRVLDQISRNLQDMSGGCEA